MINYSKLSSPEKHLLEIISSYVCKKNENFDPETEKLLDVINEELDRDQDELEQQLTRLDQAGLIEFSTSITGPAITVTSLGIKKYVRKIQERDGIETSLEELIVEEEIRNSEQFASTLELPEIIVSAFLDEMDQIKLIQLRKPEREERIVTDTRLLEKRYENRNSEN